MAESDAGQAGEEREGVVAIFDVLGTKNETAADPQGFIERLTGLVEDAEDHLQYLPHAVAGDLDPGDVPGPEVIAFADNPPRLPLGRKRSRPR